MTDPASPGADILGGTLVDMVRSRARADPDGVPLMFAEDGETWKTSLTYRVDASAACGGAGHVRRVRGSRAGGRAAPAESTRTG